MSMTDPIADLLTRIRNAVHENHEKLEVPASRIKANIVRVLKEEGYVKNFRLVKDEGGHPRIKIYLRVGEDGVSAIRGIRRVSRPGLRLYSKVDKIRAPMGGAGITIVSTSKGIRAGYKARAERVGGEVICEVW